MFDWLFKNNKEVEEPVRDYDSYGRKYLATTKQYRYIELKNDYFTKHELERHFGKPVWLRNNIFTVIKDTQKKDYIVGLVYDTHAHRAITHAQLGRQEWK